MAESSGRHFKLPEIGKGADADASADSSADASTGARGAHRAAKNAQRSYWVLDDVDLDLDDVAGEAPASHFSTSASGVNQVETAYGRHVRAASAASAGAATSSEAAGSSAGSAGSRFREVSSDLMGGTASSSAARAHARGHAKMQAVSPATAGGAGTAGGAAPAGGSAAADAASAAGSAAGAGRAAGAGSAAGAGAASAGRAADPGVTDAYLMAAGRSSAAAYAAGSAPAVRQAPSSPTPSPAPRSASSNTSDPGLTSEFIAAAQAGKATGSTRFASGAVAGADAAGAPNAAPNAAPGAAEGIGRIHSTTPVPATGKRFRTNGAADAAAATGAAMAGARTAADATAVIPRGAAAGASAAAGAAAGTAAAGAAAATGATSTADASQARGAGQAPRRKRTALDVVSTLLIVVGVVLLLGAGGIIVKAVLGYQEAASVYDELEQYAVVDEDGGDYPVVDFEALAAVNSDIVGWIYIPGTQINYPVVQTDDNSTYLTKLFDDTSNTSGTIFMDMDDTAPGLVDMQTTLYGHHMNDGSMFKFIDNTLDQDDFDTVEVVYYITAEATYVLKPLFTVQVDETYLDVREANFTSTTILRTYLRTLLAQASAVADDAEERIAETEQVLSLVTCAGEIIPRTTRAVMICTIEEVIYSE